MDERTMAFNEWRFRGLNARQVDARTLTMDRVSRDENRIVVRVRTDELHRTRYGYSLDLGSNSVLWLRRWQVDSHEVLLDGAWFIPHHYEAAEVAGKERLEWEYWVERAKSQKGDMVVWAIRDVNTATGR